VFAPVGVVTSPVRSPISLALLRSYLLSDRQRGTRMIPPMATLGKITVFRSLFSLSPIRTPFSTPDVVLIFTGRE